MMINDDSNKRKLEARLDFDNEWDKSKNWWLSLDEGVSSHYKGTPRDRLLETTRRHRRATKR